MRFRRQHRQEEFEALLREHLDALHRTALWLTRNRADAEDLEQVQEAALRAFRSFHQFKLGTSARAWLLAILRNLFISEYRRMAREPAWSEGKLPFRAKVPDLSGQGVRLLGWRLCHIQGDDVAYVTYHREEHFLSVFVFDGTGRDLPGEGAHHVMSTSAKGYQAVCWKRGNIGYLLVSDLDREALREIATHASWK